MGRKVFIGDKVVTRINTGRKTVGTSVVQLSSNGNKLAGGVQIVADTDNTGLVYVGVRENLTADTSDETDGFPLAAGESILMPVQNESQIYAIADAASQSLHFLSY